MAKKHQKCNQCNSENTELEIDESCSGEDEIIHVSVWCLDCMTYFSFDIDEDWREYV